VEVEAGQGGRRGQDVERALRAEDGDVLRDVPQRRGDALCPLYTQDDHLLEGGVLGVGEAEDGEAVVPGGQELARLLAPGDVLGDDPAEQPAGLQPALAVALQQEEHLHSPAVLPVVGRVEEEELAGVGRRAQLVVAAR